MQTNGDSNNNLSNRMLKRVTQQEILKKMSPKKTTPSISLPNAKKQQTKPDPALLPVEDNKASEDDDTQHHNHNQRAMLAPSIESSLSSSSSPRKEKSLNCIAITMLLLVVLFFPIIISYALTFPVLTHTSAWAVGQWLPSSFSIARQLQESAWDYWEESYNNNNKNQQEPLQLDIPIVHVQQHRDNLAEYLEQTYGTDWRRRPLLFKGLWTTEQLSDPNRRLSLAGLFQESLQIPYFTDARIPGALTPDQHAPVRDIVRNMTRGMPHKIGTQWIVQQQPKLLQEVAPHDIVTTLFGNYFAPVSVTGGGPFHLFPALTTVPVFIANGTQTAGKVNTTTNNNNQKPFTALHCEPIGNVAVQLSGRKQWTLVSPEYSWQMRPSVAPDGRAFFASWITDIGQQQEQQQQYSIPTYTAITAAGDAIWVPTWTWHRVDYIPSSASDHDGDDDNDELAIGASLFHFRPVDFVRNNPIFAILILPAIVMELIGYKTQ